MARRIKLGFVLLSPAADPIPSTRISVLNMLPYLDRAGFDASVVFEPARPTEAPDVARLAPSLISQHYDIVYFQKVYGPAVLQAVEALQAAGARTVYGMCDRIDPAMVAATDLTIAVTEFLKQLHPAELHDKIRVVHDGIERPEVHKAGSTHRRSAGRALHCVLVTSAAMDELPVLGRVPDWATVSIVGRYPARERPVRRLAHVYQTLRRQNGAHSKARYLRFLADSRIRLVPWHASRVYDEMLAADVGILPIDRNQATTGTSVPPAWAIKSENRLTMKMAMGLPVIATPIPSYLPVVRHRRNALLAEGATDWLSALESLRSPDERARIGVEARASVIDAFSKEAQARRLVEALKSTLG